MKTVLISFGDELVKGNRMNTHSKLIRLALRKRGVFLDGILNLPDNGGEWSEKIIEHILSNDCIVLSTGGLGPTLDDRTRHFFAKLYNKPLIIDQKHQEHVLHKFGPKYPKEIVSSIPQGAILLQNPIGSACGFVLKHLPPFPKACLIALPGPSDELRAMLEPTLDQFVLLPKTPVFFRKLFIFHALEHDVAEKLTAHENVSIGIYPSYGYVEVCLSSEQISLIDEIEKKLIDSFQFTCSCKEQNLSLEECILKKLEQNKLSLSLAESCTGGLVSAYLTSIPGASKAFLGGCVVYSDESKHTLLGVDDELLKTFSSVSPEVGKALALSCRKQFASSIGISVVGYLGPTGGSPKTPCGTVFITIALENQCVQRKILVQGDRESCQKKAARFTLSFLEETLLNSSLHERKT